jgi:predicted nucleotidyltransferase
MKEKLRQITTEFKEKISLIYQNKLSSVILFGSQARGDAEEFSDIDILVVLKGSINPFKELQVCIDIISELSLKFDTVIACIFEQEEKFQTEDIPLYKNIRREGIIL